MNHEPRNVDPGEFAKFLAEYPKGILALELSEALTSCVEATRLYDGKQSVFTLKVTVSHDGGYDPTMDVSHVVTSKPATPKPPKATFYPTETGGLSRRDPAQRTFDQAQQEANEGSDT